MLSPTRDKMLLVHRSIRPSSPRILTVPSIYLFLRVDAKVTDVFSVEWNAIQFQREPKDSTVQIVILVCQQAKHCAVLKTIPPLAHPIVYSKTFANLSLNMDSFFKKNKIRLYICPGIVI